MKRSERHDDEVGVGGGLARACEHVQDGSAEVRPAVGSPGKAGAFEGVRIDEGDRIPAVTEHGGELHGAEVGEVRIVDEVARHRDRRMHDQDARHDGQCSRSPAK